ncbi:hypothetical protein JCM16418A_06430 [Paenibacillus pini]|uniref:Uncharacterized protein n=1 Tax=Paenibacillus pini JCM 16418 TaxID=1236976 RepID=W7YDA2_9BACL|nr:hypothetical protein JCM16418_402 [Paenibacillus pini JCM 16418]
MPLRTQKGHLYPFFSKKVTTKVTELKLKTFKVKGTILVELDSESRIQRETIRIRRMLV